jgi:hypothetical protein
MLANERALQKNPILAVLIRSRIIKLRVFKDLLRR